MTEDSKPLEDAVIASLLAQEANRMEKPVERPTPPPTMEVQVRDAYQELEDYLLDSCDKTVGHEPASKSLRRLTFYPRSHPDRQGVWLFGGTAEHWHNCPLGVLSQHLTALVALSRQAAEILAKSQSQMVRDMAAYRSEKATGKQTCRHEGSWVTEEKFARCSKCGKTSMSGGRSMET